MEPWTALRRNRRLHDSEDDMIRMYSEKGGYMDCYNPREVSVAESKGWTVVPDEPVKKAPAKKKAVRGKK